MKTVIITTTIYVPSVLKLYRHINPDVVILIAGDQKTPHVQLKEFSAELGNCIYYSAEDQEKLGYESSKIIGWNKIMRRNIALLEAIKLKPDYIITIDDDNIPLDPNYFTHFDKILSSSFSGLMATSNTGWFNVGDLFVPPVYHRGYSFEQRTNKLSFKMVPVTNKKVGIAAGLWLGDPDIDAIDRIVNKPIVVGFSELLNNGIIVDNQIFTPFNSQNTAYVYELALLMMVLVGVGRYDDIWSSYISERIIMETDYHVHFGKPFVYQERNPQNLWQNLRDELLGMEYTPKFCRDLLDINIGSGHVLEKLDRLYDSLKDKDYLPPIVYELGKAWCRDVAKII